MVDGVFDGLEPLLIPYGRLVFRHIPYGKILGPIAFDQHDTRIDSVCFCGHKFIQFPGFTRNNGTIKDASSSFLCLIIPKAVAFTAFVLIHVINFLLKRLKIGGLLYGENSNLWFDNNVISALLSSCPGNIYSVKR